MYFIMNKRTLRFLNKERTGFVDFDQVEDACEYAHFITASQHVMSLTDCEVISAYQIMKILMDKDQTIQILRKGMDEKRALILIKIEENRQLLDVNTDLIKQIAGN